MKPRVFVGSSSEGKNVALSLQSGLENDAEVTVWTQDVFRPSEFILESLLKQLAATDMGIFVFSADDVVRMRGAAHAAARDNVIFEFGLYVGRLGRECSLIVAPKGDDLQLLSDLLGVNTLKYDSRREDGNLEAAVGPACNSIRKLLSQLQPRGGTVPRELALGFIERRDQLSAKQRALLSAIEARDRCTKQDLCASFPDFTMNELHYRLEQLRLLAFIDAAHGSAPDQMDADYALSAPYRAALEKIRRFIPGSSRRS